MPVRGMCTAVAAPHIAMRANLTELLLADRALGQLASRRASRPRMFVFRLLSVGPDGVSDLMHARSVRSGAGGAGMLGPVQVGLPGHLSGSRGDQCLQDPHV